MSLLDAITLAEPTPTTLSGSLVEVFVAIRNDGAKGSGTMLDPYNGATDDFLDIALSNLSADGNRVNP